MTHKKMIIGVDFDGTICRGDYPNIDGLQPYAVECITWLKEQGHYIIINTCRTDENLLKAINFCLEHKIPFDRVNDNHPGNVRKYGSNSRKIYAHIYIDDKNLGGFPGWQMVKVYIDNLQTENQ